MIGVGCCLSGSIAFAQTLNAFPTAEGFGASATGGRGGSVYHVTNLNDSGPGSLRYGVDPANIAGRPTTVVFDVGGIIQLQSSLQINNLNNVTIAGQTAPGPGIEVVGQSTTIGGDNNVIMRYMRFRAGDLLTKDDSLSVASSNNVVVDHVSTSWGMDESLSVTLSNNVTVQKCIIAETLNPPPKYHSDGSLVRGNVTASTPGGYTFSHNLWISNSIRNPAIGSRQTDVNNGYTQAQLQLDLVNNVMYNWGAQAVHTVQSQDNMYMNMVNNMFVAGPSSVNASEVFRQEWDQMPSQGWPGKVNIYQAGNKIDYNKNLTHDPIAVTTPMFTSNASNPIIFSASRYAFPTITTLSAEDAYTDVLANAGDSLPLQQRDAVDTRLINNITTQGGRIIVSQNDVGGYPILDTVARPAGWDTDGDGMPDWWEVTRGFNPNDAADGNGIAFNGYTNLENYLNNLTGEVTIPPLPEPGTLVLLATGLLGFLGWARRRPAAT
jgi:hypothetical protein